MSKLTNNTQDSPHKKRNMRKKLFSKSFRIFVLIVFLFSIRGAHADIILPENLHPVAESYRRMTFILNLNPVLWKEVRNDANRIAGEFIPLSPLEAETYQTRINELIDKITSRSEEQVESLDRNKTAQEIFELSTRAVARILILKLEMAEKFLSDYLKASQELDTARQIWASFEHEVKATDHSAFLKIGQLWLELSTALGNPAFLGVGSVPADKTTFHQKSGEIIKYISTNYGDSFQTPDKGPAPLVYHRFCPLPQKSPTFDPTKEVPVKLPPGNNINKQVPRPRQILNMVDRGVDENETALIALGDMAFDSNVIFGEPARVISLTCNTCHNKSITNPNFFIPGLSARPGGVDVSSSFFAPHANNGHFDPLDIPDLRGIRFTAPYGRNGRFASLRDFVRNVIVNEFDGPEPDPLLVDGLIAYMNEFDFLPNPSLNPDGSLNAKASESAKRGEKIFHMPFEQMGGKSCATCHVPSDQFLDRKRHDIGTAHGSGLDSRDRALDTPTLLSSKFTAPYFHDGSQPTVRDVLQWFNQMFKLGLNESKVSDLTAYVETVGDGIDPYEDTSYFLDAELEEFSFFLSAYEELKRKNKPELMNITFQTIANEIRKHKWQLQDQQYLPIMDQLAELMDEAYRANRHGERKNVDRKVMEYRQLYQENVDQLK